MRAEIESLTNWKREKERYELQAIGPDVLVRSLKAAERNGEPDHYLCAQCFESQKKSFLFDIGHGTGGRKLHCGTCDLKLIRPYSLNERAQIEANRREMARKLAGHGRSLA